MKKHMNTKHPNQYLICKKKKKKKEKVSLHQCKGPNHESANITGPCSKYGNKASTSVGMWLQCAFCLVITLSYP